MTDYDDRAVPGRLLAGQPPRWWFHGLLAVPTAGWLWSRTNPGPGGARAVVAVVLFALVWLLRLLVYAVYQRRLCAWFALAPACGLVCAITLGADLPLKARWAYAKSDFARVVRELPAAEDPRVGSFVGGYLVAGAWRERGGVFFRTNDGEWDEGGFAWFPGEPKGWRTSVHPLGDGSYTFFRRTD